MGNFVRVIATDRFTWQGKVFQAGCLYDMEMAAAKKLAADGRVKLYTGSGSVFNSPVRRIERPTIEINVKPVESTGIFR